MILRTKKLQDYINNIVDIKSLLLNLELDNRISENSEKLKFELLDKLPKAFLNFYTDFYKMKKRNNWIKIARIKETWFSKYFYQLKNSSLFNKNGIIFNNIKSEKNSKYNLYFEKKIYRDTIDISDIEDLNENANIKNKDIYFGNFNKNTKELRTSQSKQENTEEKSTFMSRNDFYNNNTKRELISNKNNVIGQIPNFSVDIQKKSSNNHKRNFVDNFHNEIYYEHSPNNIKEISNISILNNSNFNYGSNFPDSNINSNPQSNNNVQYRKPLSKEFIQKDFIIGNPQNNINNLSKNNFSSENFFKPVQNLSSKNNIIYSKHQESFSSKNFNNPHDEKPIKANPNIFNEFLDKNFIEEKNKDEVSNSQEEYSNNLNQEMNKINKKNNTNDNRLQRKTPKYDARKAIEKVKSKEKKILTNIVNKDEDIKKEKPAYENIKNSKALGKTDFAENEIDSDNGNNLENKSKSIIKEKDLLQKINSPDFLNNLKDVKMPAYGANSRSSQMFKLQTPENNLCNLKEESVNIEKPLLIEKTDKEQNDNENKNSLKAKTHKIIHSNKKSKNEDATQKNNNVISLKIDLSAEFRENNKKLDMKAIRSPNNKNKHKNDLDNFDLNKQNQFNFNTKEAVNSKVFNLKLVTEDAYSNANMNNNSNKEIKKRKIEINDKRRKILEMEKSPHLKVKKRIL
jgi:hypothetical protein